MCPRGFMITVTLTILALCVIANCLHVDQANLDKLCSDKGTERFSLPGNCQNFIQCMYDSGRVMSCDLRAPCFDGVLKQCLVRDECDCKDDNSVDPLINTYCRTHKEAWHVRIPAADCSKFYLCMGPLNDALLVQCPRGLHYSRMEKDCVPPLQAGCQSLLNICRGKLDEYTFPGLNCYEFYECSDVENGKPKLKKCSGGEYYAIVEGRCMRDEDSRCGFGGGNNSSGIIITTTKVTKTTLKRETTVAATKFIMTTAVPATKATQPPTTPTKPICTAANEGHYFAHEKCYKFYICVRGYAMEVQCGVGNRFDVVSGRCIKDAKEACHISQ